MKRLFLKKKRQDDLVLALDIGSYKTCGVLARASVDGFEVVSVSHCLSRGIKKGNLIDKEAVLTSIKTVIDELGINEDTEVLLAIPSLYTTSFTKTFSIPLKKKLVTSLHISKLLETAHNSVFNTDIKPIHIVPLGFQVDGQQSVQDPLNLRGNILDLQALMIVSHQQKGIDRLISVCESAGINVSYLILSQISSSISTLTDDDKDKGVLLVDIGGGKTEIAAFKDGVLRFFTFLPIGGNHFTNDLSIGLALPYNECERIKKIYNEVYMNNDEDLHFETITFDGMVRVVTADEIFSIINPRAEELLSLIKREIKKSGLYEGLQCAIITGGVANMSGLTLLAEEIFAMPVRKGIASMLLNEEQDALNNNINILEELSKPEFSCVFGTAIYGLELKKDKYFGERRSFFNWFRKIFH